MRTACVKSTYGDGSDLGDRANSIDQHPDIIGYWQVGGRSATGAHARRTRGHGRANGRDGGGGDDGGGGGGDGVYYILYS
jgi:hypothetical protein